MKPPKIVLLLAAIVLTLPATAQPGAAAPMSVAAFDPETADPGLKSETGNIAVLLTTYLAGEPGVMLVERQQLDSVLGEQSLGASGLVGSAGAARVGQLTGAKVLVLSRVFTQGRDLVIVSKVIGSETGRVFAATATLPAASKRAEALKAFATQLAGTVEKHASELVAPPEGGTERLGRLAKLVAGQKLPTVSVSISEQHLARRVTDPAAETEVAKTLGELGFVLYVPGAPTEPEYRIIGEAFSEPALRRGDFVSSRARVEIKVVESATGRILLQDRQTEIAVDLAEAVAAKTALQKAGCVLADRIVAALAKGSK